MLYLLIQMLIDVSSISVGFSNQQLSMIDNFSETAILWELAHRLYENIIIVDQRLRKSIKHRSENGIERLWYCSIDLGLILVPNIDPCRYQFMDQFESLHI